MPYIVLRGRKLLLIAVASATLSAAPLVILLECYVLPFLMHRKFGDVTWHQLMSGISMPWSRNFYTLLAALVMACLAPYAVVEYLNRRYVDAVEREMASFFKGLAEGVRAGMPLIKALEMAARATSGPLGREMRAVVARVEMGSSLEEALAKLLEKVDVPSLRRAATLITVAYESGGRVADVLDAAAEMYGMIRSYEDEKRASIAPYAWTVYISLAVFLFVSTIVLVGFVEQLQRLRIPALLASPIPPQLFKAIFFISSFIEAAFGGLVVGKMRGGTIKAGLLHSVILMGLVTLYFNLLDLYIEPLLRGVFQLFSS